MGLRNAIRLIFKSEWYYCKRPTPRRPFCLYLGKNCEVMRILVLLLICLCGAAQAQPVKLWDRTFPSCDTASIIEMLGPTPDGGCLLISRLGDFFHPACRISRLNAQADMIWTHDYARSFTGYILAKDGGCLLIGSCTADVADEQQQCMTRIEKDGSVAWERLLNELGTHLESADGVATPDGGWLLAEKISGESSGAVCHRYDAAGRLVWKRPYYANSGYDGLNSLHLASDGGFLLNYFSKSKEYEAKCLSKRGLKLVRIDSLGSILWSKFICEDDNNILYFCGFSKDGRFLLGGRTPGRTVATFPWDQDDIMLVCFDTHGERIWEIKLGGNYSELLRFITPTADGGWLVSSQSVSDISGDKTEACMDSSKQRRVGDVWLVRLDAAGHKLWDLTLGGPSKDVIYSQITMPDGGYLLGIGVSEARDAIDEYRLIRLGPER